MTASSRRRLPLALVSLSAVAVAVEGLALWLQAEHAILLPVPALVLVIVATKVVAAARELDLRGRLVQLANIETSNIDRMLERVIDDSTEAVIVADDRLRVLRISDSARELFDVPDIEGQGTALSELVPEVLASAARVAVAAAGLGGASPPARRTVFVPGPAGERHLEFTARPSLLSRPAGARRGSEASAIVCLTARDVTAEHEHRARMDRQARFDDLTGALNRSELVARLRARIAGGAEGCAVIAFNLHRMQTINTTLGREVGDALLVALVERIDSSCVGLSPLARLGGDAFAAYTVAPTNPAAASRICQGLSRLVTMPFRLGDHTVRTAMRAGVAEGAAGDAAELLLNKAELALDEARLRDGPGLRMFDQAAFASQERARQIERAHWNALTEEELFLNYQLQVRLADGAPVGAEALIRWKNPALGVIPPAEFISIAEGSGFIEDLGRWVLETACIDAMEWPGDLAVSVNVSPAQFHRSDLVADVERALAVSGLAPGRLYLEITESMFFDASADFSDTFAGLRRLGVLLALDDFGSGFSSFGHLARLPLDKLKVDRMFVQELETEPFNQAVIRSIVSLCRELGLKVICEGVESPEQADLLRALGCEEAQGYLYGRPEPQESVKERIGRVHQSRSP